MFKCCKIDGCKSRAVGQGLCRKHYSRLRRLGTAELPAKPTEEDRFWSHINICGEDECWPWIGANDKGYGVFSIKRNARWFTIKAHRYALGIRERNGSQRFVVMHTCDNPACCNPNHLRVGTNADNSKDRDLKGRLRTGKSEGEAHGMSKLTEDDVLAIRASDKTQVVLAQEYGVKQAQISSIIRRKSWKHI